jgi:general stress protein YciG
VNFREEPMKKEVREFLAKIGAKGGKATGESKSRGDSEYYRRLRKKGVRKQKGGKK